MRCIKLSVLLLLFASCSSNSGENVSPNGVVMNLDNYFQKEAASLQQTPDLVVKKTIAEGELVETIQQDSVVWQKEFTLFREMNTDKPNLWHRYERDTFMQQGGKKLVTYETSDLEAPVKLTTWLYDAANNLQMVTIYYHNKNYLYETEMTLHYLPSKGYGIKGWRKTIFSNKKEFDIFAEILNRKQL